jgi:hypothetical protein
LTEQSKTLRGVQRDPSKITVLTGFKKFGTFFPDEFVFFCVQKGHFMFSPQEKKQRIEENLGDPQNEKLEIDVGLLPTLGHVAKETRFDPLRNLLEQVKDTPVNELSAGLRTKLQQKVGEELGLLMESFFAACDAAIRRLETARKRPRHSSSSEEEPGESSRIFYFFLNFFFPFSSELKPFDVSLLCSVGDVKVPPVDATDPPFTSEPRWLEETESLVLEHYKAEDGKERVPPMALVRCSRGGKTRALEELARMLKAQNIPVVMISLNDYSSLKEWEKADSVGAVCRRIAFAASHDRDFGLSLEQYIHFSKQNWNFTAHQVEEWLGNDPCVFLIDELNNLPQSRDLAEFLKRNFVSRRNRYLVFTSHVLATTGELSAFMDSASSRQVILRPLPLIPSLKEAAHNLSWPSLNAREALYYGMVPSLIHEAHLEVREKGHLPTAKRNNAIQDCLRDGLVTKDSIRKLLTTFCSGDVEGVLLPLQQLMTAVSVSDEDRVQWIPFHMMEVLRKFSAEQELRRLEEIVRLFNAFKDAKESSGDGWESLFVAVLLIRCWAQMGDQFLLPVEFEPPCTFSYNKPFQGNFATQNVHEFVAGIKEPHSFPHIAVYYPTHASFQLYDVIVAHFDEWHVRRLYGYQLKEGKALPKDFAMPIFEESYVIRGEAAKMAGMGRDWVRPSEQQIDAFFGVSGQHWTPRRWKQLCN